MTEAEHRAALAEIERLWDADASSPEGKRLMVLIALVDAYEDEYWAEL